MKLWINIIFLLGLMSAQSALANPTQLRCTEDDKTCYNEDLQ